MISKKLSTLSQTTDSRTLTTCEVRVTGQWLLVIGLAPFLSRGIALTHFQSCGRRTD